MVLQGCRFPRLETPPHSLKKTQKTRSLSHQRQPKKKKKKKIVNLFSETFIHSFIRCTIIQSYFLQRKKISYILLQVFFLKKKKKKKTKSCYMKKKKLTDAMLINDEKKVTSCVHDVYHFYTRASSIYKVNGCCTTCY